MGKKVLIVEDDMDIRLITTAVLEENGYEPLAAKDGKEGLSLIRSEKPDLVILDVLMPRQSGVKLYRELRSDDKLKSLPVIVLSGITKRSFIKSQIALSESGDKAIPEPEAYLEKPVEPHELAEVIKGIIG